MMEHFQTTKPERQTGSDEQIALTLNSDDQLLRLPQVIGPEGLLPISRSTFYDKIKQGELPEPVKLGPRISTWKKSDILAFVAKMEAGDE